MKVRVMVSRNGNPWSDDERGVSLVSRPLPATASCPVGRGFLALTASVLRRASKDIAEWRDSLYRVGPVNFYGEERFGTDVAQVRMPTQLSGGSSVWCHEMRAARYWVEELYRQPRRGGDQLWRILFP